MAVRTPAPPAAAQRALTPRDVPVLRLNWRNRLAPDEARDLLIAYPDRSVWDPASREFAIVGPWRHRPEIAVVRELAAVRHAEDLLTAVVDRCRAADDALVLVVELDETRRPAFYARAGLAPLEEIVTYELEHPSPLPPAGPLTFAPITHSDPAIADLVRLDHSAFPWLWWNSAAEFDAYLALPDVEVYLGRDQDGEPLAYVGITSYTGWGHLDRIAVAPDAQGHGLGHQALAFAIAALARRGARRVGLSTQEENLRSRRLYEGFGFRRSRGNDYKLYAAVLRDPEPTEDPPPTSIGRNART